VIGQSLLQASRVVAEGGDFNRLFEYLAPDVEFSVSIEVRSPTREEIRGRQSVIAHLRSINGTHSPKSEEPVDVFVGGQRIVSSRNATVAIGADFVVDSECTLVFDVHDGMISRFAIHYELSNSLELPTAMPLGRRRNGSRAPLSVVKTVNA